jgi:hypothetical protein
MNNDLIFVTAYCPTQEQIDRLSQCIDSLPNENFDIALITHSHVPLEIQKKCQYYIYDHLNDLSDDEELRHFEYHSSEKHRLKSKLVKKTPFYGFSIYRMFSAISKLAENYGYKRIYHVEYDYVIKDKSIFTNHKKFLQKFDSVFYKIDEDDDMILGGLKSFNVDKLPELFKNYNKEKMVEMMKNENLIPLEEFTKKIFSDAGNVLLISKSHIKERVEIKKFTSQELNWCYCYNEKDGQLYLFYLNIINDLELIGVKSDDFYDEKVLTKDKYYIKSLGDINNIHNLTLLRNKTIVSEINITEEFKEKIKKYSIIELLK